MTTTTATSRVADPTLPRILRVDEVLAIAGFTRSSGAAFVAAFHNWQRYIPPRVGLTDRLRSMVRRLLEPLFGRLEVVHRRWGGGHGRVLSRSTRR